MAKKRKGVYARDIDQLNVVFALVALGSLLSVLWMIWDDYARQWKDYQREFQLIAQELTRQQLTEVAAQVDQQRLSQLRQERDQAEQALGTQQETNDQVIDELARIQANLSLADQNLRFARSTHGARRWEYEEARHAAASDEEVAAERQALEEAESDIERYREEVELLTLEQQLVQARVADLRRGIDDAESQITATTREIDRVQTSLDSLRFDWVHLLRNAPFMDGLNPSERIQQVVLSDVPLNLNFTTAPRVDRCQTCHLGIDSAVYEEQQQPFASHPRLDLFVSDTSSHPVGRFGCTVCHNGKGHATSFASAVHTPSNESEEERWKEENDWYHVELWEWPMRPSFEIESGCLECHTDDVWLPDAPDLEYGLRLIDRLGCYGCHQLDRFEGARKRGPSLEHVGVKTDTGWAYNWVMDPKSFRSTTMMPNFFNLENTSDSYWTERNQVEVDAIVSYLFDASDPIELQAAPPGNATRGEQLVNTVGCRGCHMVDDNMDEDLEIPDDGNPADWGRFTRYSSHGPNLNGVGSKVNADWLFTWVSNPQHYWTDTVMPNLRLTRQEAADVTAYLQSLQLPEWDSAEVPNVDNELRQQVVLEYLRNQLPAVQAQARLAEMGGEEQRIFLGGQLINRYGCSGCHLIPGFENAGRIGTSLSEWGSKPVNQIDFGLLDLPHERRAFLEQKLAAPRSLDQGKIKAPQELFRMPDYQLLPEEIDAIATALLGHTKARVPIQSLPQQTPKRVAVEAGRAIANRYNCRGCHVLEDRGGAIRDVIAERRMAETDETLPAALAYAPPDLQSEGARVQPDWLYRFFKEPSPVRPWLNVRMPTFAFDDTQLNALTAYFALRDEAPYPFEDVFSVAHSYPDELVRQGEELAANRSGSLQCWQCHVRGGVNPLGDASRWSPDLAMAAERLRPAWIDQWIKDPQSLQPGTRMPQFYPDLSPGRGFWEPLDRQPQREIDALVAYVMSLGR